MWWLGGPGWGWGGNPYPFCRFYPWLPRGWWWAYGAGWPYAAPSWWGTYPSPTVAPEAEPSALRAQAEALRGQLEAIAKRIEELERAPTS